MNSKILPSCSLLLFALPLSAREKSDAIVMRNGDRLTCEIKGLDFDILSVSLDYASGPVSINWGKVDHIESKQLSSSKPSTASSILAASPLRPTPGARPTKIEVLEASARKVELDKTHVIKMQETDLGFWRPFNESPATIAFCGRLLLPSRYSILSASGCSCHEAQSLVGSGNGADGT